MLTLVAAGTIANFVVVTIATGVSTSQQADILISGNIFYILNRLKHNLSYDGSLCKKLCRLANEPDISMFALVCRSTS